MLDRLKREIQWPHFIAGLAGGAASTLALHPLDLAKIRLQVNEGTGVVSCRPRPTGLVGTLADIVRSRGVHGLYAGLTPNLIGASGSWGLYFFLYAAIKLRLQDGDASRALTTLQYLGCGTAAGSLTLSLMNPIWVVKTRLCLQYESLLTQDPVSVNPVTSTWCALVNLWRSEGFSGLYRGYAAGLLGVTHGAIQFMLYEKIRNWYNEDYLHRLSNTKLTALEYLTIASLSKLLAVTMTYPYQVLRSRMQDQHRKYNGLLHVIRELIRYEGIRGFYKGLFPNLLRVTPACSITFLVYEYTSDFLKQIC